MIPAPSTCHGRRSNAGGAYPTAPLTEMICAENDLNFFNYVVVPIPQADKPDF